MWKPLLFFGIFVLLASCKSPPPLAEEEAPPPQIPPLTIEEETPPLQIMEPELIITSITILQADLINTRFKLGLKISNPNPFPITLSSFRYELHGDGTFWADGRERNLAVVPAQSSVETYFNFEMNFINMKRKLLDDIIAMREVRYRVKGSVEVTADGVDIPGFRMDFDYSGNSEVLR